MKLQEYGALADKSDNFHLISIDNRLELDEFIKEIEDDPKSKHYIYRGVSEAKYMIYTSAQRYWVTQELEKSGKSFDEFIQALIDNALSPKNNNSLLKRYFNSFNIPVNEFLILSYLQHYKAPSPLIDFSDSIYKSLFFCFDESSYVPGHDIENYCSLYIINTEYLSGHNELLSLPDFLTEACNRVDRTLQKHPNKDVGTSQFQQMIKECPYKEFKMHHLLLIPGIKTNSTSYKVRAIPNFVATTYMSNLNLIAQDGVFIFYNDPLIPLEEYFLHNNRHKLMLITCVNIHKSLKDYIIEKYLKPKHISHDSMYPQEEDIAKQAFSIFKKEM